MKALCARVSEAGLEERAAVRQGQWGLHRPLAMGLLGHQLLE